MNVTHNHYFLLPRFLRFGYRWLGRERKLEIGHIASQSICVVGNEAGAPPKIKEPRRVRGRPESEKRKGEKAGGNVDRLGCPDVLIEGSVQGGSFYS